MKAKRWIGHASVVIGTAIGGPWGVAGCTTASRAHPEGAEAETLSAARDALDPTMGYPAMAGERAEGRVARFRIESGTDAGAIGVDEQARNAAGGWVQRWSIGDGKTPQFERDLSLREDGALVMSEQRSIDRKVKTVFTPPLVVLPADLSPGDAFTQTVSMTVHPIDRPKSIKEQGTATLEVTLRGQQAITAAGRDIECRVVRSVFTADLKSADVVRTTDRWYSDELGLVAEQYEETVKVLGVVVERTSQRFVLTDAPQVAN